VNTFAEVKAWHDGAAAQFGDASVPVCQCFFQWHTGLETVYDGGEDLVCGVLAGDVVLVLGPTFPTLPLPLRMGEPEIVDGELVAFGVDRVAAGVWQVTPSLNYEGLIHAFVVLVDVPDPAPWERRIVIASSFA
jgi:hypothetical protein